MHSNLCQLYLHVMRVKNFGTNVNDLTFRDISGSLYLIGYTAIDFSVF